MDASEIAYGALSALMIVIVVSLSAVSYNSMAGAYSVNMHLHEKTLLSDKPLDFKCASGVQRYRCAGMNVLVQDCLDPSEGSLQKFCQGGCTVHEDTGASCEDLFGYPMH